MAKMTMSQELEMLRKEIEQLKNEKGKELEKSSTEENQEENSEKEDFLEGNPSTGGRAEKIENELKEQLQELVETFKKDYENLSPVAAVLLFALGAAFGRAISSR